MLELMWPYRRHVDLFAGTQRYASEHGNWYCEVDEFLHEDSGTVGTAPIESYDGLVARATSELAVQARACGVPLVNVWYNSPARDQTAGIFQDFSAVGREAALHLLERGHRQFGCLSDRRDKAHTVMISSFQNEVDKLSCPCSRAYASPLFYRNAKSWSKFQLTLDSWIESWEPPIAIFVAFNDVTARYIVHACRRHGLKVPEDVALITSSNEKAVALMPSPSLSSVEIDYELIGYQAAKLLDEIMEGREDSEKHIHIEPGGVILRESTNFFAIDDELVSAAMRFIERSTKKPINVGDVAAATGVTRRTLERRFERHAGRSVSSEIRRLRLNKATRLLAETDLLIKEVAMESGFRDPIRMHEAFVRQLGVTPSRYRELKRRGDPM